MFRGVAESFVNGKVKLSKIAVINVKILHCELGLSTRKAYIGGDGVKGRGNCNYPNHERNIQLLRIIKGLEIINICLTIALLFPRKFGPMKQVWIIMQRSK